MGTGRCVVECKMGPAPRLRIQLDPSLSRCVPNFEVVQKIWWQPSKVQQDVGQMLSELAQHLGAADLPPSCLLAELDGFALLHASSVALLRDGDLLLLRRRLWPRKRDAEREAAQQAAAKKQRRAAAAQVVQQQQGGEGESSDTSSSSSSSEEEEEEPSPSSKSEGGSGSEEEGQQQQGEEGTSPGGKSERFHTPAAMLVGEKRRGGEGGEGFTGEGATGKRPSRSARRKAAKRRLRREGVLPPSTGRKRGEQQLSEQQQQAEGAGDQTAAAEEGIKDVAATGPSAKKGGRQKQQGLGGIGQAQAGGAAGPGAAPSAVTAAADVAVTGIVMHRRPKRPGPGNASKGQQLLLPSGLKAKRVSQDGHIHFAGSSDDEENEEEGQGQAVQTSAGLPSRAVAHVGQAVQQGRVQVALPNHGTGPVPDIPEVAVGPRWLAAADHSLVLMDGLEEEEEEEVGAAAAARTPISEEEFGRLPAVQGAPAKGSVVAYKLLEIGPELAPQVSEVRLGHVVEVEAAGGALTLAPYPDASHPLGWHWMALRANRAAAAAAAGEGELEEEEEQDLGAYEEDGTLRCDLSSFVEMRLLHASSDADAQGAEEASAMPEARPAVQQGSSPATAVAGPAAGSPALEDVGPSSYSQLGPPRAPIPGGRPARHPGASLIPPEGGWASLYQQLQKRRAELAQQQQDAQQLVAARGGGPRGGHDLQAGSQQQPEPSSTGGMRRGAVPVTSTSSGGAGNAAAHQGIVSASCNTAATSGHAAAAQQLQRRGSLNGGTRPQGPKPRGGVRASALGPILRMLRSSNELE